MNVNYEMNKNRKLIYHTILSILLNNIKTQTKN